MPINFTSTGWSVLKLDWVHILPFCDLNDINNILTHFLEHYPLNNNLCIASKFIYFTTNSDELENGEASGKN